MERRWVTLSVVGAALAVVGALLRASRGAGPRNVNATVPYGHGSRIEELKTIAREPLEVYAAWRDLESLPLVMPHVKRVENVNGGTRSRWTVAGPGGAAATWEADIFEDVPGERIAWRADDAPVKHAGTVRFAPAPGGRGTEVHIEIEYVAPGGPLAALGLRLTKKPPLRLLELDLRRFKSVLEAGDVAVNGTDVAQ
jgi:uncharacterized membrane protein